MIVAVCNLVPGGNSGNTSRLALGEQFLSWRPALVVGCWTLLAVAVGCLPNTSTAGGICDDQSRSTDAVRLLCSGIEKQDGGDIDGAMSDFERALELQPDLTEAHLMLGIGYYHKTDDTRALEEYDKYLAVIPDNFHAWSNRAAVFLRTGDLAAARADIDRALALNADDPVLLGNRIVIAREAEDWSTVISDSTWLLEHFPTQAIWLVERGRALGAESRLAESLADLERAVNLEPTASAYLYRGVTLYYLGQYEAAVEDFTTALTNGSGLVSPYLWRCRAQYRLTHYQAGLPDCDEYVMRSPEEYEGYYARGILRSRAGIQDGAIADYRRAIELAENPRDSANAWYGLGLASERAGRKKDAAKAYEQTLDIDPGYDLAKEALKRVGR
jgi:tetratricopeptide (TPR) repeat protein